MDNQRIGGGLLAGAGVIAPWVGQMIGLKLGTAAGIVILALCAVAFVVGLALIFCPAKQSPLSDRRGSVTASARGRGKIELDGVYSTADKLAHADEDGAISARDCVHNTIRTPDRPTLRFWPFRRRNPDEGLQNTSRISGGDQDNGNR